LFKAAAAAEARGWKISEEKDAFYKKALTDKGMKIHPPPAKLVDDLRQVGAVLLADWEKAAGADGQAIVAAYRAGAGK
jgi:TRAP-type C4-dicarboxylate transport system substrate-binding protein